MLEGLSEEASTLSPLPPILSKGLIAVSLCGLLSFIASTGLFLYLTYRIIDWRIKNGYSQPLNQLLVLIYSLLFADIQQAMAFLLNFDSIRNNAIRVGTTTCWAQGWFVSTGDLASSVMITAIGIHTLLGIVKGYRPSTIVFYSCLAGCWIFIYLLGALGPWLYGADFYVRASAWCWINNKYAAERLWLHYFWMFVCIFVCVATYTFIVFYLRTSRFRSSAQSLNPQLVEGATPLMIAYPFIYTVCTTPLAAGRIYALQGNHVGLAYFCVAGAMIASNGWLDVLLYASTRRDIVFGETLVSENTGLETFAFYGKTHRFGNTTTIQANAPKAKRHERKISTRERTSESVENLYMGDITIKGEVSVKVEDERNILQRRDRIASNDSIGGNSRDDAGWDTRSVKSGKSILMDRV